MNPTPREMDVLAFIEVFRRAHEYSPTYQEIGDRMGISKVTVWEHVSNLCRKGIIRRAQYGCRAIEILRPELLPKREPLRFPILGEIR